MSDYYDNDYVKYDILRSGRKSKRSRYRVGDELLRFRFRFVEPNRSSIEEAPDIVYGGTIAPNLPDHVATTFEGVCQEVLWEAIRRRAIEPYANVWRWWFGEAEIDIVGLAPNDDRIRITECKWTSDPVGETLVEGLRDNATPVRGPEDRAERFALFSKSGFVDGLADDLDQHWSLFGLGEIEHLLGTD